MKREDIEMAAERNTEEYVKNGDLRGFRGSYRLGFIAGAEWRINSVWHDASKRPDERRAVIIEYGENRISLHEKGYDGPWKYNVEQFGFKRWAYVDDLIPNTED